MGRGNSSFVFFNIVDERFWKEAAWFCRDRAGLVQMNSIVASVESKWKLSFIKRDSCVAVGKFVEREKEVKPRRYSGPQEFANGRDFPSMFFKRLRALHLFPRGTLAELYKFV